MKLVFYSGGHAQENEILDHKLLSLSRNKKLSMAVIPACSYVSDEYFEEILEQYQPLGVKKIIKFDADRPNSVVFKKLLFKTDIIHLGGGNTYYFLKHLKKSGLFGELKKWCSKGGILTGLSAGAIIMTKNIATAGFPAFDKDENEEKIKNFSGLGLVDFLFFPHYRNSKRYDESLTTYSKQVDQPVYALPDGSGIIMEDDEIRFVGKTVCFYQGKKTIIFK